MNHSKSRSLRFALPFLVLALGAGSYPAAAAVKATPGGTCSIPGSMTAMSGKNYICSMVNKKLIWAPRAPLLTGTAKPTISSAPGGEGGGDDNGAAFQKYQACLTKAGVKSPFGGRPTGQPSPGAIPSARPTLSAKDQAATAKCASLLPKGFGGANGGGFNSAASTAYLACLKTNGLTVASLRDLRGMDSTKASVAKALKACASKRPQFGGFGGNRPPAQ